MRKIIKGILVVLLVLFVFILATWITLVCQIERTVERNEIEQERSLP